MNQESYSLELSLVAPNCFKLKATQVGQLQQTVAQATAEMEKEMGGASEAICRFGVTISEHRDQIHLVTNTVAAHDNTLSSHAQAITGHQDHLTALSETVTRHNSEIANGCCVREKQGQCIDRLQAEATSETTDALANEGRITKTQNVVFDSITLFGSTPHYYYM